MRDDEDGMIVLGTYENRKILRERDLVAFVGKRLLRKHRPNYY